jgi:hypothetical protein
MADAMSGRLDRLRKRLTARRDHGTVTPMMLVMAGGILILIGLAYDGGTYYDDQQHADFVAQEAARAGAQDIDVGHYLATGRAGLDPDKAKADVLTYLGDVHDLQIDMGSVAVYFGPDNGSIQVTFRVDRSGVFLSAASWGIDKAYGNAVVVLEQGVTDAGG